MCNDQILVQALHERGPSPSRSNSHPVAGLAGITNFPLAAVGLRRTIPIFKPALRQMIVRSVPLDLPS